MGQSKSERMEQIIREYPESQFEKEYHGFFICFNEGLYYEAHDVLEHLWLQRKNTQDDHFFKALIQVAGAFVHISKGKLGPAKRLFVLAKGYFAEYPDTFRGIVLAEMDQFIQLWINRIEEDAFDLSNYPSPSLSPDS